MSKEALEDPGSTLSDSSTLNSIRQKRRETTWQPLVKLVQVSFVGRKYKLQRNYLMNSRTHWPSDLGDRACVHTDKRWDGSWRGNLDICYTRWIPACLILFYCTSQIPIFFFFFFFLQIEDLWQSSVRVKPDSVPFFQQTLLSSYLPVTCFGNFPNISDFSLLPYLLWWSVITDLWC